MRLRKPAERACAALTLLFGLVPWGCEVATNLIDNGDFETGLLAPEWTTIAGSPTIEADNGGSVVESAGGLLWIANIGATPTVPTVAYSIFADVKLISGVGEIKVFSAISVPNYFPRTIVVDSDGLVVIGNTAGDTVRTYTIPDITSDYVTVEATWIATQTESFLTANILQPGNDASVWRVDNVRIEEVDVAVKLAERGVDAVVSILQADLAGELTAIDTDRGDGVTMAAPPNGNYYTFPRRFIGDGAGGTSHVEVFEGAIDFESPYADSDAQRATYELPMTVRLTFFNRDGDTDATMADRARRYSSGVFNVVNKKPTLGGTDAAIQVAGLAGVESVWETDGEEAEKLTKCIVTMPMLVRCEEVQ